MTLEPYDLERWDEISTQLEDPDMRGKILERGRIYTEHTDALIRHMVEGADLVEFEGYTVYLSTSGLQAFTDFLGHDLAAKQPPLALMVRVADEGLRVSLRGDGSVDVAKIAQKYGGNGHPSAAAFRLSWGTPVPWKPVPKDEGPRH